MKDPNRLLARFSGNPKDWIAALHAQFTDIAEQNRTEIIATYQTLDLCHRRAADGDPALHEQIGILKEAAVSRMYALCHSYSAGGGAARFQLCREFYQITGHSSLDPSTFSS